MPSPSSSPCLRPALVLLLAAGAGPAQSANYAPEEIVGRFPDGKPVLFRDLAPMAELDGVTFKRHLDLSGVPLMGANLFNASLPEVALTGADLSGAVLTAARLLGADLTGTKLDGADLTLAILVAAKMDPGALDPRRVILKDTLGPDGTVLAPSAAFQALMAETFAGAVSGSAPAAAKEAPAKPLPKPKLPPREHIPLPLPAMGKDQVEVCNADLSSFFAKGLPKGTLREIHLGEEEPAVTRLVPYAGGLAWLGRDSNLIQFLSPHGRAAARLNEIPNDLGITGNKAWWTSPAAAEVHLHMIPFWDSDRLRQPNFARVGIRLHEGVGPSRPGSIACMGDYFYIVGREKDHPKVERFKLPTRNFVEKIMQAGKKEEDGFAHALNLPSDGVKKNDFLGMHTDSEDLLLVHRRYTIDAIEAKANTITPLFIGNGSLTGPRKAAVTADRRLWITTHNPGELRIFDLAPGPQEGKALIVDADSKDAEILDLALGPDGCVWFTQPLKNVLGYIAPKTQAITRIPLRPGSAPWDLVNGGDGNMYCNLVGTSRLAAISAEDGAAATAAAPVTATATAAAPVTATEPAPPAAAPVVAPKASLAPPQEKEPEAAEAPTALPAPAPAAKSGGAATKAPGQPMASLAQLTQLLASKGVMTVAYNHILERHHFDAPHRDGHFLPMTRPKEELATLVLQAMNAPTTPLTLETTGGFALARKFPMPIGYYWDRQAGDWVLTRTLKVALTRDLRTVKSAYPVKEF